MSLQRLQSRRSSLMFLLVTASDGQTFDKRRLVLHTCRNGTDDPAPKSLSLCIQVSIHDDVNDFRPSQTNIQLHCLAEVSSWSKTTIPRHLPSRLVSGYLKHGKGALVRREEARKVALPGTTAFATCSCCFNASACSLSSRAASSSGSIARMMISQSFKHVLKRTGS